MAFCLHCRFSLNPANCVDLRPGSPSLLGTTSLVPPSSLDLEVVPDSFFSFPSCIVRKSLKTILSHHWMTGHWIATPCIDLFFQCVHVRDFILVGSIACKSVSEAFLNSALLLPFCTPTSFFLILVDLLRSNNSLHFPFFLHPIFGISLFHLSHTVCQLLHSSILFPFLSIFAAYPYWLSVWWMSADLGSGEDICDQ
jgi:hypothetical protein